MMSVLSILTTALMIKTAHNKRPIKRIPPATKCAIAIQAITHQQTITEISKSFNCSRTTVHAQKARAMEAAANAFEESDEEILFTIAVTKAFIHMMVVALFLICGSSYRGILFFLESILGYSLSLGSVFNILDAAADKAAAMTAAYDLSSIKSSAADEVFHRNQPILGIVDIESRYCALLAQSNDRARESWAIHLLYLQAHGYAPDTCIVDSAKGLIKGYEIALPKTALRHDHFHIIRDLKDCARFLKNEVASQVTEALKLVRRKEKARETKKEKACAAALSKSLTELSALEQTYATFQLLVQWLQHDVLQLAGYQPEDRARLYDFIVTEMTLLAKQHPHRIGSMVTSLTHQRNALLGVANALNDQFAQLATHYNLSIHAIWKVCYTARYGIDSCHYHERSSELEMVIGKQYEDIEDAVLSILENTHRCSSMVENLNSRVRPYLDERKFVSQKILSLIQFYLNHKPFMRSTHKRLVKKTPAEAMTGKPHRPWLEMLDFPPVTKFAT